MVKFILKRLGLSLINPKGYAAMAALFSGFVLLRSSVALDVALKIALLTILIAVSQALLIIVAMRAFGQGWNIEYEVPADQIGASAG